MRFLALFSVWIGMPIASAGGWSAEDVVVKTESRLCAGSGPVFKGSGTLLRSGERTLVLTSEHVVLQSSVGVCHSIESPALTRQSARLVAADWGSGLALLELDAAPEFPIPTFSDWNDDELVRGSPVDGAGFPHASSELVYDERGTVLLRRSDRHQIPLLSRAVEISGAHGEFGMSGGPVFASGGRRVVGMLSHQYLELVPGGLTRVGTWSGPAQVVQNQLIVIPAAWIKTWVSAVLGPAFQPSFTRSAGNQLTSRHRVYSGGLEFELVSGGGTGGIGGSDGAGIGGSDGAGIGGEGNPSIPSEVRIRRLSSLPPGLLPSGWKNTWIERLHSSLKGVDSVTVRGFILRGETLERLSFQTLEEFVRLLQRSNLTPIAPLSSAAAAPQAQARLLKTVAEQGSKLRSGTATLRTLLDASQQVAAALLLQEISTLGELLESGSWELVPIADLERLRESDEWRVLFNLDGGFDASVSLMSALRSAADTLRALKVE